jgi:TalC/MipB family fructose-6-phosphate aldolase
MEIFLDSANLEVIKESISWCPLSGVTTNPSIISKEGTIEFFDHLKSIKRIIEETRVLHVQVIAEDHEGIIEDAKTIKDILGSDVYIKIPATKEGLIAIKTLSNCGFNITATAIYSTLQGAMCALAGAKYIAVYYNRIENNGGSASGVISELAMLPEIANNKIKILAASFKNTNQVISAFSSGAQACTLSNEILCQCIESLSVDKAITDFRSDWNKIYGLMNISEL